MKRRLRPRHFLFYKNKIRLTYEDVIEAVLSSFLTKFL